MHVPEGECSLETAREALEFVESVGYFLDPWQAFLVEQSLLERPDSKWLAREFAYLVPRQNGKGGVLTARSIIDLFFLQQYDHYGDPEATLVVHTAHQYKTATEAFLRLRGVIEGSPDLRKMMKQDRNHGIKTAAGEVGFELQNGNRLRYLARAQGGSGRGFSIHTLLLDEAQEFPQTAADALFPTQRAMANPQRILTGTVPDETNNGEVWETVRDKGRAGTSGSSSWAEYAPDERDPETKRAMSEKVETALELDGDLAYALATNPAVGYRVTVDALRSDVESMKPLAYQREVLCWWPSNVKASAVLRNWPDLHDPESDTMDPVVFAVEVAEDRSVSCIVAVGPRSDGLQHVEVIDYASGTDWVVDRLIQLQYRWSPQVLLIDVGGPAGTLVTDLEEAKVPYRPLQVRELGQACGMMFDAVSQRSLRWMNHAALNTAVNNAKWRPLGASGAKAWDRKVDVDISPLMAASMALWGLVTGEVAEEMVPVLKQPSTVMYGFN